MLYRTIFGTYFMCPNCGHLQTVELNTTLPSDPPKYRVRCENCGLEVTITEEDIVNVCYVVEKGLSLEFNLRNRSTWAST